MGSIEDKLFIFMTWNIFEPTLRTCFFPLGNWFLKVEPRSPKPSYKLGYTVNPIDYRYPLVMTNITMENHHF